MFQRGSQDAKMFYHLATRQASGEPISHGQQDRQPGPDNPERAVLDFFFAGSTGLFSMRFAFLVFYGCSCKGFMVHKQVTQPAPLFETQPA